MPAPAPPQNIVFKIDAKILGNLGSETLAFTASSSIPLTGYVWDFGDGTPPVSGGAAQSHTYVTKGLRTVRVTAQSDTRGQLVTVLGVVVEFKIP